MARRNESVLDALVLLPWWVNVILSALVYLLMRYWIPSIDFGHSIHKAMASALPLVAPYVAGLVLLAAAVSAFNAWRKGALLERQKGIESIRSIGWREFEELVGEAYRRRGYRVTETGGGGADGGVDLVLRRGGEKLFIQCKHWRMAKVGVKVVRELYGVIAAEGATGGILISSGTFTQEAKDFARGKPLELIEGNELTKMIVEVQKNTLPTKEVPKENQCPLCGGEMLLRTARKGSRAGEKFWGCAAYPKCRGTKPCG